MFELEEEDGSDSRHVNFESLGLKCRELEI